MPTNLAPPFIVMLSSSQDQSTSEPSGPKASLSSRWFRGLRRKERTPYVLPVVHTDGEPTPTPPSPSSKSKSTALTAAKLVLQALSAMAKSTSLPALQLPFDSLLYVMNQVETTLGNAEGFKNLAERLEALQSTLSKLGETGKASTELDHLLEPLRRELEALRNDINTAVSRGSVESFINSTDDASSLASHNTRLNHIISQLTLDVSVSVHRGLSRVESRVESGVSTFQEGLTRVENALGGSAAMGVTQIFRGAKINTSAGGGNGTGGHIGSGNIGLQSQDYENADIATGGGNVGSNNISLGAVEKETALLLRLRDGKFGTPV